MSEIVCTSWPAHHIFTDPLIGINWPDVTRLKARYGDTSSRDNDNYFGRSWEAEIGRFVDGARGV